MPSLPFRRKASTATPAIIGVNHGKPARPQRTPIELARDGYMKNVDVFRCVNLIAECCGGIDWILLKAQGGSKQADGVLRMKGERLRKTVDELRRRKSDDFVQLDTHPLLDLIRRPNPAQANTEFVREIIANRKIYGNAYIERVGPGANTPNQPPLELWSLRPDRMSVIVGAGMQLVGGYQFKNGAYKRTFEPEMVLHSKTYHPLDDWYGMSPIESIAHQVDHANDANEWNRALLENGGMPGGFIVTEDDPSDDQIEQLKQMREGMRGPKNAGKIGYTAGGTGFIPAQMTAQDISWLDGLKLDTLKICEAYGVPPEIIGDQAQKTYSNYQEARRALYMDTILPEMDDLRDALNAWLVPLYGGGLMLDYDRDTVEALQEDRSALFTRLESANFLTINEKRVEIGLPDVAGGDVVMVPIATVPLDTSTGGVAEETALGEQGAEAPAKSKAWNLSTREHRQAHAAAMDAMRDRAVVGAKHIVQGQLHRERKSVTAAIASASGPLTASVAAQSAVDAGKDAWTRAYQALYTKTGTPFAADVLAHLKADADAKRVKASLPHPNAWVGAAMRWLAKHGAERVTQVTDTTKRQIADQVSEGIAAGEGTFELSKRIDTLYLDSIIPNRSEVIARTETLTASNLAGMSAAESTGLPLDKTWLAVEDNRTRSDHSDADGQQVPMSEPFDVGGEQLMFPGDTSLGADAGEIINCRCTQGYAVSDGSDTPDDAGDES